MTRIACVVAVATIAASTAGAEKRPMTPVDLLEVPSLSDPQLSPDGRQVVFVLEEADWERNDVVGHLWRAGTGDGEPLELTRGDGESSPRWSPDGGSIAFLAKREGDEARQIYLLDSRGGEARRLTRHPTAVSSIAWLPDGSGLHFLADDPKSSAEKKRAAAHDDVYAFEENWKPRHLWRVAVADGATARVTEGDFSVLGYSASRDGRRIAHHRAPTPLVDDADEGEVWIMDADGGNAVQLTRNTVVESGASLSPDGETVLFTAGADAGFTTYFNKNLFLVPAAGGEARLLLEEMPWEVQDAAWSADGSRIYFTANTGVRAQLFAVDPRDESLVTLTEGDRSVIEWSYSPSAGHVFGFDTWTNPGDLWRLPEGAAEPSRLTHLFDGLAEEFELPRQEVVRWTGEDGADVEGLLLYPLGYREGTRVPLIVQSHGGPAASDRIGFGQWRNYGPVAAALGYATLRPNYRGSTGYGDAFLRDMVGHYFHRSHVDVLRGVDHVIAMGVADPERLVKMGWSGGGHMTNKIITVTDRFKAASSGAGAVDWVPMYAQSDLRTHRTPWFGGSPWEEDAPIALYWEHSPLKDIYRAKTPTLIFVGENDARVPMPQSVELYRALRANGVPTHLFVGPREPHGWGELRHRLFKINAELEWFERHARGRDYTWVRAPGDEEAGENDASAEKGEAATAP